MAVLITQRPIGYKIIDQPISASLYTGSGDAYIIFANHGLVDGDVIYIESTIYEYNGFFFVDKSDNDGFKIYTDITFNDVYNYVPFYQEATITYYQTRSHGWNSGYLPIVYTIDSNLSPNTFNTARTVSSFTDDNGYVNLNLSGALNTSVVPLSYVKLQGYIGGQELDGVYQILTVNSTSDVTINLVYDSAYSFSGSTFIYHYNNYHVKVKVYAGLNASHPWQPQRPYEEVGIMNLIPDDDGKVMFSIHELIKGKFEIKNDLTIFSWPLNIHFFTQFYIAVAESYDVSDGDVVTTFTSSYTSDQGNFEGYAMAGMLPFKNIYSGWYSDYVYTTGQPAKWLVLQDVLQGIEGYFFDVSFIKSIAGDFKIHIDKYISDYVQSTEEVTYTDQGIGVYRIPLTLDSFYDSFCIQAKTIATDSSPGTTSPITPPTFNTWISRNIDIDGFLVDWTTGTNPSVNIFHFGFGFAGSETLYGSYAFIAGYTYTITVIYNYTVNTLGPATIHNTNLYIMDNSFNQLFIQTADPGTTTGIKSISITFIATSDCTRIGIDHYTNTESISMQLTSISGTETTTSTPGVEALDITNEICINILEVCEASQGPINPDTDNIRLTEDGDFRILE